MLNILLVNIFDIFSDKVRGISFCENSNQLLSVGEDCVVVCWDMTKFRDPVSRLYPTNIALLFSNFLIRSYKNRGLLCKCKKRRSFD